MRGVTTCDVEMVFETKKYLDHLYDVMRDLHSMQSVHHLNYNKLKQKIGSINSFTAIGMKSVESNTKFKEAQIALQWTWRKF